jgi:putative ATPase
MSKASEQYKEQPLLNILFEQNKKIPLAEALRPKTLQDFIGQSHLVAEGTPLYRLIEKKQLFSVIFWGPPGVGKTTLARLIANNADADFIELSAVSSGLKELRAAIEKAKETLKIENRRTVIFLDEIHHHSKMQQDAILHDLENGNITLVGATTENPSFQVIPALLSRLLMIRLQPLDQAGMTKLIQRAIAHFDNASIQEDAINFVLCYANGDGRSLLNLLELAYQCGKEENGKLEIEIKILEQLAQQTRLNYEASGDAHYDHASAYQKSMRGSDVDAALYWLGKMVAGGEDPRFIARRLLVCASEDVGIADPMAFVLANAAYESVSKLGWPEARIPLAQATVYIAKAPKSNKAYKAIDAVLHDINKNGKNFAVPMHLRDSHYKDASKYGHGEGYIYSHNAKEAAQEFLPPELRGTKYFEDN